MPQLGLSDSLTQAAVLCCLIQETPLHIFSSLLCRMKVLGARSSRITIYGPGAVHLLSSEWWIEVSLRAGTGNGAGLSAVESWLFAVLLWGAYSRFACLSSLISEVEIMIKIVADLPELLWHLASGKG